MIQVNDVVYSVKPISTPKNPNTVGLQQVPNLNLKFIPDMSTEGWETDRSKFVKTQVQTESQAVQVKPDMSSIGTQNSNKVVEEVKKPLTKSAFVQTDQIKYASAG